MMARKEPLRSQMMKTAHAAFVRSKAGIFSDTLYAMIDAIEPTIRADEREKCARLADEAAEQRRADGDPEGAGAIEDLADAIRRRA